MTGGPPTKSVQSTVYAAPWRALVARKMVWYSFNWSPKVRVTPLSETVFVAADAARGSDAQHQSSGKPGGEHAGTDSAQDGQGPSIGGRH